MPRRFSVVLFTVLLSVVFLLGGTLTGAAESIVVQSAPMLQTTDNAYCVGNDLHVDLTIDLSRSDPNNLYRVAGSGPNLPSGSVPGSASNAFTIPGPGAWTGLHFECSSAQFCADPSGWKDSVIYTISPNTITCGSTEPPTDEPTDERPTPTPVPGCDVTVYIPSTAVNGLFLDNAAVFWKPGSLTNPLVVIEAGKTYRVDGLDASGVYRKVLISCTWAWVEADKVGPDPTGPWYGKPLPNHVTS